MPPRKGADMAKVVERVPVFVPKESGQRDYLLVGVNGKLYQVPRGETVNVPVPVKDIIDQRERNKRVSDRYIKKQQKLAKKIQGVNE